MLSKPFLPDHTIWSPFLAWSCPLFSWAALHNWDPFRIPNKRQENYTCLWHPAQSAKPSSLPPRLWPGVQRSGTGHSVLTPLLQALLSTAPWVGSDRLVTLPSSSLPPAHLFLILRWNLLFWWAGLSSNQIKHLSCEENKAVGNIPSL